MKYHHLGIPTTEAHPDEVYHPHLKMYTRGFEESEFGIEWMRFAPDCDLPELVKTVPHVAFAVDDLEQAIKGRNVIIPSNSPSESVRVAFVEESGVPIEFIQLGAEETGTDH